MNSTSRIRKKDKQTTAGSPLVGSQPRAELLMRVARTAKSQRLQRVLPGGIESLWWGVHASGATPKQLAVMQELFGLLVAREPGPNVLQLAHDVSDAVQQAITKPAAATLILMWAYALPELTQALDESVWWGILEELESLSQSVIDQAPTESWQRLMIGGELTAILAWRLGELPSCHALAKVSRKAFESWAGQNKKAITQALANGGVHARLILASALRQLAIRDKLKQGILRKSHGSMARKLLESALMLCRHDGTVAFSEGVSSLSDAESSQGLSDDRKFWKVAAAQFHAEGVQNALRYVKGKKREGTSLTDEASMPDPYTVQPDAGLMAWRSSWHSSHGRIALKYGNDGVEIEMGSGPGLIFQGAWNSRITIDGKVLVPKSGWEQNCWYTDDEVHYFELQRQFEGDVRVQRQFVLLRDHHVLGIAEGVLAQPGQKIEYKTSFPLTSEMVAREESETREVFLSDAKKERAVVIPLGLNEWRIARSPGALSVDESQLSLKMTGTGRLDAALAFDLKPRRFSCPRTWRQLTVAEDLKIVGRDVAVGYRLQLNDDQWLFYRTLAPPANRTVLGKNLSIDYFVGQYDASDGFYEELLNIESDEGFNG